MILGSLALIIITGYIVEALRLAAEKPEYAVYSPIGNFLATVFYSGMSQEQLHSQHFILWLFHGIIAFDFCCLDSKHLFCSYVQVSDEYLLAKTKPRGNIPRIAEIEEQESFGISKFNQFNWQFRLNFDACTECGRCTAVCPVNRAGGPLDPREIILSLKRQCTGITRQSMNHLLETPFLRMLYWPVQLAGHVLNNVLQGLKSAVQLCK